MLIYYLIAKSALSADLNLSRKFLQKLSVDQISELEILEGRLCNGMVLTIRSADAKDLMIAVKYFPIRKEIIYLGYNMLMVTNYVIPNTLLIMNPLKRSSIFLFD